VRALDDVVDGQGKVVAAMKAGEGVKV